MHVREKNKKKINKESRMLTLGQPAADTWAVLTADPPRAGCQPFSRQQAEMAR